ncbi:MAG TPA: NAD(P) transhydrogenase subunit alpha [Actinomycetota bacterium]|jgi:H+-translocating NAD(P) transhydrogenase subunit alpha|nr:NAD(P) transhydrogenase subunit alpha [Actinomycetota bacterium]
MTLDAERPPTSVGVARETDAGETRVAIVPAVVPQLTRSGLEVLVERGAGASAGFPDDAYETHGARLGRRADILEADIVVRVRGWGADGLGPADSHPDQVVIGMADPLGSPGAVRAAAEAKLVAFALDLMPRITRAQPMDALSSQATVAGYRAALLAAHHLPKLFPMLTTAAGTIPPAQVFVIGAGVAGLQAIATARRLGALVQAYDVRPAAQEEIESLGARSVLLPLAPADAEDKSGYAKELGDAFYRRQQELLSTVVAGVDVVVTTAFIPGAGAPVLITADAVAGMHPGAVIVDCAAERGGNCELTRRDETIHTENGVSILGPTNLPATVPHDASLMYAKNAAAFLGLITKDGRIVVDEEDEIVRATLVASAGEVVHPRVLEALEEARDV